MHLSEEEVIPSRLNATLVDRPAPETVFKPRNGLFNEPFVCQDLGFVWPVLQLRVCFSTSVNVIFYAVVTMC